MAFIEINNDHGTVLISETTYPHRLVGKGLINSRSGGWVPNNGSVIGAGFQVDASATLATQSMPILALRPTSAGSYFDLFRTEVLSSSVNWIIASEGAKLGEQFEYFLIQDGLSAPLAGTGLVVIRDAANRVTFDSDAGYASMVDFVTVPLDGSITRTYPSGRKYAVAPVVPCVRRVSSGPGGGYLSVRPIGASINNNVITFQHYCERPVNGVCTTGSPVAGAHSASFIVFDVTGL